MAEEITLNIHGMKCGACAYTISACLNKLDGVSSADVSFDTKQVVIRFDPAVIKVKDCIRVIDKAGYRASLDV